MGQESNQLNSTQLNSDATRALYFERTDGSLLLPCFVPHSAQARLDHTYTRRTTLADMHHFRSVPHRQQSGRFARLGASRSGSIRSALDQPTEGLSLHCRLSTSTASPRRLNHPPEQHAPRRRTAEASAVAACAGPSRPYQCGRLAAAWVCEFACAASSCSIADRRVSFSLRSITNMTSSADAKPHQPHHPDKEAYRVEELPGVSSDWDLAPMYAGYLPVASSRACTTACPAA